MFGAEIVDIKWRSAFFDQDFHDLNNYIWTHNSFVEADYVLDKPHVTLHGINDKNVWFCIADEDVYNVEKFPFAWYAQNTKAKKFVIMKIGVFLNLMERKKIHFQNYIRSFYTNKYG